MIHLTQAQHAELLADKARLDFLEAHPMPATVVIGGQPEEAYLYGLTTAPNVSMRDAIDVHIAMHQGVKQ